MIDSYIDIKKAIQQGKSLEEIKELSNSPKYIIEDMYYLALHHLDEEEQYAKDNGIFYYI